MSGRGKSAAIRVSRTYTSDPTSCIHALRLLLKGCTGDGVNGHKKAAELSPTTVLKLENAETSTPHPRTIRKLATALDVDPHELFREED
jgi:transcriptional regulator with XRE-family HTH domain